MSEYLNHTSPGRAALLEMALGMLNGKRNPEFISQFDEAVESATARDVIFVVDGLVKSGKPMPRVKKAVSQVVNLLYSALLDEGLQTWSSGSFLGFMAAENRQMEKRMEAIKALIKAINVKRIAPDRFAVLRKDLHEKILELNEYQKHYERKEQILFPCLEKIWEDYRCLQVMWSMHDDMRKAIKNLDLILQKEDMNLTAFNREIGALFFAVLPVIYREENILFPIAMEELEKSLWNDMLKQSAEIGYAFIETPQAIPDDVSLQNQQSREEAKQSNSNEFLQLGTGNLSLEQIVLLFDHLPVDITFVDENDEVRYFNNSKGRHFTRSKSTIGRKVQNCHPPESIDVVNRIVESFRNGVKDHEDFWINMKGKKIHIRYFAIRDGKGIFRGTLEVSQDITDIKSLEGERRLMDESGA